MKSSEKDTFVLQSLLKLLHSFMFLNPTALAYDRVKIIVTLILIPLRITILFPLFLNSSTNSEVQNTSPKWIFAGVQQSSNQGRRQMEGRLHYKPRQL